MPSFEEIETLFKQGMLVLCGLALLGALIVAIVSHFDRKTWIPIKAGIRKIRYKREAPAKTLRYYCYLEVEYEYEGKTYLRTVQAGKGYDFERTAVEKLGAMGVTEGATVDIKVNPRKAKRLFLVTL